MHIIQAIDAINCGTHPETLADKHTVYDAHNMNLFSSALFIYSSFDLTHCVAQCVQCAVAPTTLSCPPTYPSLQLFAVTQYFSIFKFQKLIEAYIGDIVNITDAGLLLVKTLLNSFFHTHDFVGIDNKSGF